MRHDNKFDPTSFVGSSTNGLAMNYLAMTDLVLKTMSAWLMTGLHCDLVGRRPDNALTKRKRATPSAWIILTVFLDSP